MLTIIAAIDKNGGIGYDNKLLVRLKEDMQRFKQITECGTVIMGYHTFTSLPKSQPLSNRTNIVITHRHIDNPDVITYDSIDPIIEKYAFGAPGEKPNAFVIGGESIYSQLIDYCSSLNLTRIYKVYPQADRFFPLRDTDDPGWDDWSLSYAFNAKSYEGEPKYRYLIYDRERVTRHG